MKKDIRMISGCEDKQTSADVSDVNRYVKKILICLYMPVGRKEKKKQSSCRSVFGRIWYSTVFGFYAPSNFFFAGISNTSVSFFASLSLSLSLSLSISILVSNYLILRDAPVVHVLPPCWIFCIKMNKYLKMIYLSRKFWRKWEKIWRNKDSHKFRNSLVRILSTWIPTLTLCRKQPRVPNVPWWSVLIT